MHLLYAIHCGEFRSNIVAFFPKGYTVILALIITSLSSKIILKHDHDTFTTTVAHPILLSTFYIHRHMCVHVAVYLFQKHTKYCTGRIKLFYFRFRCQKCKLSKTLNVAPSLTSLFVANNETSRL